MSPSAQTVTNGTASTRKRNTSRDIRSASPVKQSAPTPNRPKATPRKRRTKKDTTDVAASVADSVAEEAELLERDREEEVEEILEAAEELAEEAAGEAAALEAIALAEAAAPNGVDEEDADPVREGNIRVSVTEDVIAGEDDETTHTTVKIEMPADSPDLALPQDTEGVVAVAREIIKDAKEMQENSGDASKVVAGKKRKADALEEEEVAAEISGPEEIVQVVAEGDAADLVDGEVVLQTRPTKRTRVMVPAEEYRREKVKRRALMGLSGALAVGVMLPFISNLF